MTDEIPPPPPGRSDDERPSEPGGDAISGAFEGADWDGGPGWMTRSSSADHARRADPDATAVRRVRVRKKAPKRRRRRYVFVVLGLAGLLLLAGFWLLYTGLAAKSQLETVRDEVHKLRAEIDSGNLDAARVTAKMISDHAAEAHDKTSGPIWSGAAALPFFGKPLESVRTLTQAVDSIATDALPSLVDASKSLDPKTLREPDGAVNLAPIAAAAPTLDRAAAVMQRSLDRIDRLPTSTWLGAVNSARSSALKQLNPLTKTIVSADIAADTVPAMLGIDGPKSYMVAFENEAELRGTGGLPGAFAIVKADHGKLSFTRFEPDDTLYNVKSGLDLGSDFDKNYNAADVTGDYRDANISPNFPYAARIWLAEWKVTTGQTLDGAMTLDPTALSYLLKVAGPASLPDGSQVTADNVVKLTQQRVYADFTAAQNDQRKQYLLDIAKSVSARLIVAHGDTTSLVKAAGKAAAQHRLLVWSSDPAVEARLSGASISGALSAEPGPSATVAINNAGGSKLDYYLHASTSWRALTCGSTRKVQVTITLTNDAPLGLPKYVLGFTGKPGYPTSPGDNRMVVAYYGTSGGQLTGVTLDGKASSAQSGLELGHPVFTVKLVVPRGGTSKIVLTMTEPGSGTPTIRTQPMVNPMTATATAAC
ncbi:DUF4012 domain-containing protein [Jatrophihabitans sp.]|uniref:DUF4012 domain-containing protein n=1 Tax=Jatrophihabitans sp. TaxID=1932789 RepID=UPI0030C685E5|nr:hypothetical protein [Jatrophihabitans sp.]